MVIGEVVIYAVGVPWLAVAAHFSPELAIQKGLLPFVLGMPSSSPSPRFSSRLRGGW